MVKSELVTLVVNCSSLRTMLVFDRATHPESSMSELVKLITSHLPYESSLDPPHGEPLGPKAKEVIKWTVNLERIEKFFRKWSSDQREPARCILAPIRRSYAGCKGSEGANAIGMQIGDHWYIEFGETGNACYRPTSTQLEKKLRSSPV